MISSEVEDRIARYFFHQYLPEDVRLEIVGTLLPFYLIDDDEDEPSAVRFFCRIEREKTKPMAFSVANMQNMGLLIPISMCGHKQDSVFFIRRHDKETYGYSIF
jgi:hypothetical protein